MFIIIIGHLVAIVHCSICDGWWYDASVVYLSEQT